MMAEVVLGEVTAVGRNVHLDAVPVGRRLSCPERANSAIIFAGRGRPQPLPNLSMTPDDMKHCPYSQAWEARVFSGQSGRACI